MPFLPHDSPRYLMGVGKPDDIIGAALRGIDMFDCVWNDAVKHELVHSAPLDPGCRCPACKSYSRAYLHHVVKAGEIIASMLLTWHNLTFFQDLLRTFREAVTNQSANEFAARFLERYRRGEEA